MGGVAWCWWHGWIVVVFVLLLFLFFMVGKVLQTDIAPAGTSM